MDSETLRELIYQTIQILSPEVPGGIGWLDTYESIKFPEGYEKPPKEAFEAKLQELIDGQPLVELRTKRNKVISSTDYLFTSDFPHATPEKKQEWLDYRQALRDLPSVTEDPANPVWPTPPE